MTKRNLTPAMDEARSVREANRAKAKRRETAAQEAARRERKAIREEQARLKAKCLERMAKRT